MNNQAHTFHPNSDSFEDRVNALSDAFADLRTAQASKTSSDERLGDEKEKAFALEVSENTLNKAISSFSKNELERIKSNSMLNNEDLVSLVALSRSADMQAKRNSITATESKDSHQL